MRLKYFLVLSTKLSPVKTVDGSTNLEFITALGEACGKNIHQAYGRFLQSSEELLKRIDADKIMLVEKVNRGSIKLYPNTYFKKIGG